MSSELVWLSAMDTERFGVKIARTNTFTHQNILETIDFCSANQVELLIGRCSTRDIQTVHAAESQGFRLMDTLVYLRKDLTHYTPLPSRSTASIEVAKSSDQAEAIEVALVSFDGYQGHYHADNRLDRSSATAVYGSWAGRCFVDPQAAHMVHVAKIDGRIVAFRASRMNTPQQGEFVLTGVIPEARRLGIYKDLVIAGLNWCKDADAEEVLVSTLLDNIGVLRAVSQFGFAPAFSYFTFHKWFN